MGEATYYLKANGCTKENFEAIKKFFHEGCKAEDYWQAHRGVKTGFWEPFEKKFPTVSKYLESIGMFGKDHNNLLAGHLDFGSDAEVDDNIHLSKDRELKYSAYVWHFAEWDGLMTFLESNFGLTNARWLSDEYLDPYKQL
jgi:hypothetical protein